MVVNESTIRKGPELRRTSYEDLLKEVQVVQS